MLAQAKKAGRIGRNCLLAPFVRIYDHNGHPLDPARRLQGEHEPTDLIREVVIGDNVWIGEFAHVQPGVHVGDDSIIAAHSVVVNDVAPNTVVFGFRRGRLSGSPRTRISRRRDMYTYRVRPMKVAYLLTSFPNTSETFILNEIVEALGRGIDIRVFSLIRPSSPCPHAKARFVDGRVEYLPPIEKAGLSRLLCLHAYFLLRHPVHYIGALFFVLTHLRNETRWAFQECVLYARVMETFKPALIHTHFALGSASLSMLIAKILGVRFAFRIHCWFDMDKEPRVDLEEIIVNSKHTVTVCDYNRRHLMETYRIPAGKLSVLRCGIVFEDFLPPEGGTRQEGLVVSIGRLHFHKAYHNLIDACSILRERGVSFHCLIVGEGELHGDLQARIDRLDLTDKVQLLGETSNEEVRGILCRAQGFGLPSVVEVLGMANGEAMATGLPVVATGVFGVPELVEDGVTGLLCEPNNPAQLADALQTLVADPQRCAAMGAKGREKARRDHDITVQAKRLTEMWEAYGA